MTDLADLPFVAVADVYKNGQLAASLRRTAQGTEFGYFADYSGSSVATTLPLGSSVFTVGGAVPPFFAGLLPEGRRLSAIRTAVKTSADDELSLLLAIGHDTVGDVQIVPSGSAPTEPAVAEVADSSQLSFRMLWANATGTEPERTGLAGVQPKVSARMISFPVRVGAGRFILKLNPPEFPHVVENEACFLAAARRSGLQVPAFDVLVDNHGERGLLVTRFDRSVGSDKALIRHAQEDGCQVLGRYPSDKYTAPLEQVINGLAQCCPARAVAARELLRQFVFAHLTGNGDQHAKNLSIVNDGEWRASPCYDVPSTFVYNDHTTALAVGGKRRQDVTRRHVLALADAIAVRRRSAEAVIDDLLDRLPTWLDSVQALPFDQRRLSKLDAMIRYRRDQLAHRALS